MSRAFVRESDADPGQLPDRPISPHANFVTRRGLAAIDARLRELEGNAGKCVSTTMLRSARASSANYVTGARGAQVPGWSSPCLPIGCASGCA